jgi:hypothetical protein
MKSIKLEIIHNNEIAATVQHDVLKKDGDKLYLKPFSHLFSNDWYSIAEVNFDNCYYDGSGYFHAENLENTCRLSVQDVLYYQSHNE